MTDFNKKVVINYSDIEQLLSREAHMKALFTNFLMANEEYEFDSSEIRMKDDGSCMLIFNAKLKDKLI